MEREHKVAIHVLLTSPSSISKKLIVLGMHFSYLPTLERENNRDFTNDIFWLCMKFKATISFKLQTKRCMGKKGIDFTLMCFTLLQQQNTNMKYVVDLK